jgi:hypothetical protein
MGCGAVAGGVDTSGVDLATQAVIHGVVTRSDEPVGGAYVRLLDRTNEFTAEVPTGDDGEFRFFAAEGDWTIRVLTPGASSVDRRVHALVGGVSEVRIAL